MNVYEIVPIEPESSAVNMRKEIIHERQVPKKIDPYSFQVTFHHSIIHLPASVIRSVLKRLVTGPFEENNSKMCFLMHPDIFTPSNVT